MGQDFHFTEDTCGGGGMSRRGSGAVQREWVRCSSASPVVLNNAAREEEKRPTSSLNGRHRSGVAVSRRLILAHLTGEPGTPDRRGGEGQRGARMVHGCRGEGDGGAAVTVGELVR